MDDLLSEKEQIEQIRSWWSEYGAYVIGGLVIGIGILVGINYYTSSKLRAQTEASTNYEVLTQHVADGNVDEAEVLVAKIANNYPQTVYVAQSGLAMARLYMDRNRDQDAASALLAIVDSDASAAIRNVARLRLARIYLYQDKAQDAVDLLQADDEEAFAASYGEVLGDAFTALGQFAEAKVAYQSVVSDPAAQGTVDLNLVQWKMLDLPEIETAVDELPGDSAEPQADTAVEADVAVTEENE